MVLGLKVLPGLGMTVTKGGLPVLPRRRVVFSVKGVMGSCVVRMSTGIYAFSFRR